MANPSERVSVWSNGFMNMGPSGKSSWLEIGIAAFFVLLVFGIFIFAFSAPIVSYFVTHKERWADYTRRQRVKVLTNSGVVVLVGALLIWLMTDPFAKH
jgi:hypothetical protein